MRCLSALRGGRLVCLAGWLVLTASTVHAIDPDKMPPADDVPVAVPMKIVGLPAPPPAKPVEKLYSFEMRDKPWNQLLEWVSELTGLPFVSNFKPTGTFTFIGPKGAKYTVPQVIDIVNEALLAQKFVMIRRTASLTIVPADEKIDPAMVPQITPEELAGRGKTEIVSMVIPLTSLVAEDFAPEVKKMMSPFAEVVPITRANQLMLQDTAGSLQRVMRTIKETEETEKGQADSFSHTCKYVKAREAERILRELLGDPKTQQQSQSSQPQGPWWAQSRSDRERQSSSSSSTSSRRMHYISADDRTNSVMVTGPADKIAQAREIMRKLDVPQQGQPPVLVGPPILKTYSVPSGNATVMATTLQDVYKEAANIRISAVGAGSIMVWAGPEDQFEIAKLITGSSETASTATELVPAGTLEAANLAVTLKGMFPGVGAAYIEADVSRNAIIIKGTKEQVAEVKAAVQAIGGGGGASGNMRIINLDQGSARTLAEALERMLPQMRQNPVRVITPGSEPRPEPSPEPSKNRSQAPSPAGAVQVASANLQVLDDPQAGKKSDLPGKKDAPVTITAVGNRLIVTSNDPEALALVSELVRLITAAPTGEGDFEIIRLKNARAADAARILDEAFNGPKQPAQSQRGGRDSGGGSPLGMLMGGLGGLGGMASAIMPSGGATAGRIRVVADSGSNSLLVRASPLDMLEIRRLLDKAIDSGNSDSAAILRTYVIGPLKHSNATEVAALVRDVYQEYTNSPRADSGRGGFGGFSLLRGGSINRNVDADGNPRTVSLSVGVDDRTNSLVVWCSEAMFTDITRLVEQLEASAQDSTRTVKVVSIKGVDPILVQQAIDAIQGRRTTPTSSSSSNSSSRRRDSRSGSSGFTPFGTGGFVPGGSIPSGLPGMTPGGDGGSRFRGFPSGGSGGGGDRPPGRSRSDSGGGGSPFFVERVKDDPSQTLLFDPQRDTGPEVIHVGLEEEQQAPLPADDIRGPRAPVTAEALEELGVLVISGNNQADVEAVVRIIEYIQKLGAGAEVHIQLVPLQFGDATSVSTTLSQLFSQVTVGAATNVRVPAAQQNQNQDQPGAASIVLLPLPRFNAILLAAPRARVDDMIKEIRRLDQPTSPTGRATPFPLKKAAAARVSSLVQQFYATRYPNDANQIRVTFDESTNTVFVQAAPADLTEIRGLIERLDTTVSSAVNDLRIVPLQNAISDELANLLMQAISQGSATGTTGAGGLGGVGGQPGGALGGAVGGVPIFRQPTGAAPGAATGLGGLPGLGGLGGAQGAATKSTTLRFVGGRGGKGVFESGLLEDVYISSDYRTNSLIISAPGKTVELLLALIRELDVPPAAQATIKIFSLKKADAANTALLLQNLFLGTGGLPGAGGLGGGGLGGGGLGGGLGGGGLGGGLGGVGTPSITQSAFGGAVGIPRMLMTLGGLAPEGPPLIDLRISVDPRTNSIIIAGGPNDLEVIEAIINRLDDTNIQTRHNEVYKLKNAQAVDIATALQDFLSRSLQVISIGQQLTGFQELERDVVIVPEPITNTLLISATPQYFGEVMRLITQLDALPPQVVIQVLVAEVNLRDVDEFGIELGLQSPVLFQRGLLPSGTVVNETITAGIPGFNFNQNPLGPLPNSANASPGIVGYQGLGNLGTGRISPNGNIGGFVFAASSNSVNVLVRALKTQQRIDVLSRPQIMTMDGQTALMNVGQEIPIITGSNVTATGIIQTNIDRRNVGVILQVTPRINPDGTVVMRVVPEISSVRDQAVPLGDGLFGTSLNIQHVETTVVAGDGETVVIGGLITKREQFDENKVPWFGDLPLVGALFRYRSLRQERNELMVILTPHVVRSRCEADEILAEEARRMDWVLSDVAKVHGTSGMAPILSPVWPPPPPVPPAMPEKPDLPQPRPLPQPPAVPAGPAPASFKLTEPSPAPVGFKLPEQGPPLTPVPTDPSVAPPAAPGKEKRWKFFN